MERSIPVVYHTSTHHRLTRIEPRVSTHGQPWVYAARTEVIAMMFLTVTDEFVCASGDDEGMPFIVERFAGAFDHAYGGVEGSLYTLPSHTFVAGLTGWDSDLVSSESVVPLSETFIADAKVELLRFVDEGRLLLKRYPERLGLPEDDEDLVRKAVEWQDLDKIKRYHPHLIARVQAAMAK